MNSIGVNQVLNQIRSMQMPSPESVKETQSGGKGFADLLVESIEQVNDTQIQAGELSRAFELGDENVDLPQVMVAMEKASVSFEALKEVRNKMVSAYQEVMNMQL